MKRAASFLKTIALGMAVTALAAGLAAAEETAPAASASTVSQSVVSQSAAATAAQDGTAAGETKENAAAAEEKIDKILGKKAEGEHILHVIVENASGGNIVSVSVIDDMTDLPIEEYLADGEVFADGEKRILYYDEQPAEEEAARRNAEAQEGTPEIRPAYLLRIAMEDGSGYDLHGFTFEDMKEGRIEVADGVAYMVYTSVETGEKVETKEAELAEKARREEEQQQAYVEPVYEQPVYQEPIYQEPVYEAPAPVYDAGAGDQCIGDGLTW